MDNEKASQIVDKIIRDLKGRKVLRQEWEEIDSDIQQEIRDEWIGIVVKGS